MCESDEIFWPTRFAPANCHVNVRNELDFSSQPEMVWAWLIRAQLWPTWYPNSAKMRFIEGQPPDLAMGTRFKWKTGFLNPDTMKETPLGVTVDCRVREFLPPNRLSFEFNGTGISGYQAWLITKTEAGCRVLTEERQLGILARVISLLSRRMEKQHQIWLEGLSKKAMSGLPPAL